MRREKVSVSTVEISKAGYIKHFQIKLPKTAKQIIGVEIGHRLIEYPGLLPQAGHGKSADVFKRSITICDLKLQSCEDANVFFASTVQLDKSLSYGDFTSYVWKAKPFSHQALRLEEEVKVDANSTIIQGIIMDCTDPQVEEPIHYFINIYVWVATE